MRYGDIVTEVKRRTRLPTVLEADKATRATLNVLGHRLDACPGRHLALTLPPLLASELPDGDEPVEFGLQEFYERAAQREGASLAVGRSHVRAVIGTLHDLDAVPDFDQILAELPDDYADLLEQTDRRGAGSSA